MIGGVRLALNAMAVVLLAAGLAAAAATLSAPRLGPDLREWAPAFPAFMARLAVTFLPSALLSFLLMPRAADLRTAAGAAEGPSLRSWPALMLLALAAVAALQLPLVAEWWNASRDVLVALVDPGGIPSRLRPAAVAILVALPATASLALLSFGLSSLPGLVAAPALAARLLLAGVAAQAGLVLGAFLARPFLGVLKHGLAQLFAADHDAVAAAVAHERAVGAAVVARLIWTLCAYAAACVLIRRLAATRDRRDQSAVTRG